MTSFVRLTGVPGSGVLKYVNGAYVNNSLTAPLQATYGFAGVVGRFYVQDPRYLRSAEAVYVNTNSPSDSFTVKWQVDNKVSSMGAGVNFSPRNATVTGLDINDDPGTYRLVSLRLEDYWASRSPNVKTLNFTQANSPSSLTLLAPPTFTYQLSAPSTVDEGGFADFTVTRAGGSGFVSSVVFSTLAGSATAGEDFVAVNNLSVNFGENESSKVVRVKVVMDQRSEGTEVFSGQLMSATGQSAPVAQADVSIRNLEPTFNYAITVKAGVAEGSPAYFDIIRTGTTDLPSTVYVSTRSGSATQGVDFDGLNRVMIRFNGGQQEVTGSLLTREDSELENVENYFVEIFNSPTATQVIASASGDIMNRNLASIIGTSRAENLVGNAFDNVIIGMGGADVMSGGDGKDTFRYINLSDSGTTLATQDKITDFRPKFDKIDLTAIDANPALAGDQAFTGFISMTTGFSQPGQMKLNHNGNHNYTLMLNTNTNAAAESAINIQLIGIAGGPPASFSLSDILL